MLGKKASLRVILDEIKSHQIPVVETTEFVQGKTWRWAVAWSFDETLKRKTGHIVHRAPKAQKRKRPVILQVLGCQPSPEGFQHAKQWLQEQLNGLQRFVTSASWRSLLGCRVGAEGETPVLVGDPFWDVELVQKGKHHLWDELWVELQKGVALKIEWFVSGEDSKAVHLHCKAHKNTWSHQRRKKRLLQRLKSKELQAQPGAATVTGGGSITTGMDSNQSHSKQQTEPCPTTDECCSSSADVATLGTKTQDLGSEKSSLDDKIACGISDVAKADDPLGVYTPCNVEFQCSLLLGSLGEELGAQVTSKKCKLGEVDTIDSQEQSLMMYLSFEWIQGSERDLLHQITQYFRNKIQNCAAPKLE